MIGITRRFLDDGSKKTYPGTRNGIFVDPRWSSRKGPLLIVEGASDVAAGMDLDLPMVGRPSCTGGVPLLETLIQRAKWTGRVIVVGERDEKPQHRGVRCPADCRGCVVCWPGMAGAVSVAKSLREKRIAASPSLVPIAAKDFRDAAGKGLVWGGAVAEVGLRPQRQMLSIERQNGIYSWYSVAIRRES